MKISAGKNITAYANLVGAKPEEVVLWVSGYVNGPWSDSMAPYMEKTPELRLKSIQDYISLRLETSIAERIKREMVGERIKNAVPVPATDICPF